MRGDALHCNSLLVRKTTSDKKSNTYSFSSCICHLQTVDWFGILEYAYCALSFFQSIIIAGALVSCSIPFEKILVKVLSGALVLSCKGAIQSTTSQAAIHHCFQSLLLFGHRVYVQYHSGLFPFCRQRRTVEVAHVP